MEIADVLLRWYLENKRELPWRDTTDPYRIWVSEIILQQTRVAQGLDYFNRFMERFPTVEALAEAAEDEVMKYWQGLGYYSRARNLHAAAKEVMGRFGGVFPQNYRDVLSLKGIGEYTAAAVCSFAWRQPYAVVDGNVYRVLARFFGIGTPIDSTQGKKEFAALAQELLDRDRPDLYNQAIMDFGHTMHTAIARLPLLPFARRLYRFGGRDRGQTAGKSRKDSRKTALFQLPPYPFRGKNIAIPPGSERHLAQPLRIPADRIRRRPGLAAIAADGRIPPLDGRGRGHPPPPLRRNAETHTLAPRHPCPFL